MHAYPRVDCFGLVEKNLGSQVQNADRIFFLSVSLSFLFLFLFFFLFFLSGWWLLFYSLSGCNPMLPTLPDNSRGVCTCVCVCVSEYTYVTIYIYIYIYLSISMYISLYIYMYVCIGDGLPVTFYTQLKTGASVCLCMYFLRNLSVCFPGWGWAFSFFFFSIFLLFFFFFIKFRKIFFFFFLYIRGACRQSIEAN